jgi:galactonate dehydratase
MSSAVEDRGASIRVTRLTAIPAGRKGYVKLETSQGITGWGEINNMNTPVACSLAESMAEIVVGENPTRVEHLWQRMFRSHRNLRNGGLMVHTISAIDMALWDITGKLYGVPNLPEGPGLGVEMDETLAREVGQRDDQRFYWPDNRLIDGSVADY